PGLNSFFRKMCCLTIPNQLEQSKLLVPVYNNHREWFYVRKAIAVDFRYHIVGNQKILYNQTSTFSIGSLSFMRYKTTIHYRNHSVFCAAPNPSPPRYRVLRI